MRAFRVDVILVSRLRHISRDGIIATLLYGRVLFRSYGFSDISFVKSDGTCVSEYLLSEFAIGIE